MQQKRLVLALLISTVVLIGWNYLFPIKSPQNTNKPAPTASPAAPSPTANAQASPAVTPSSTTSVINQSVRQRGIIVTTPLYHARFDNQGAVATSWILTRNKDTGKELTSAGSDKNHTIRLELISEEGLKHVPREAPFALATGDPSLDYLLSSSNFEVEGFSDSGGGDLGIKLAANEQKRVNFVLRDSANNLEVTKAITFKADTYSTDLEVKIRRGNDVVQQVKVQTGPSIGDQGLKGFSFYSVAPEAIAAVGDEVVRHTSQEINENKKSPDHLPLGGEVDWAGIGDTYFAMVVIPARRVSGLEYFCAAYEVKPNGKAEKRYLIRGLVPVPADGSKSAVYIGPKDHYVLERASGEVSAQVSRNIDLDGLINYGFGAFISRPIAQKLLWCIKKLYQLTGSYGVAIILFTIIIYSAFFPLKWRSSKAMKKAQKHAPKMKELQEK